MIEITRLSPIQETRYKKMWRRWRRLAVVKTLHSLGTFLGTIIVILCCLVTMGFVGEAILASIMYVVHRLVW